MTKYPAIFDTAKRMPTAPAFSKGHKTYSFAELLEAIEGYEKKQTSQNWERVLIFQPFGFSFLAALLATLGAGHCAVVPAPYIGWVQMRRILQEIGVDRVESNFIFGLLRRILLPNIVHDKQKGRLEREFNAPSMLVFTSGSTGVPKVGIRHMEQLLAMNAGLKRYINFSDAKGHLTWFPAVAMLNFMEGVHTIFPPKWEKNKLNQFLRKQINSGKISHISGPPTALICLVADGPVYGVRQVFVGGAIVGYFAALQLQIGFPGAEIKVIYGSTEVEPACVISLVEMVRLWELGAGIGVPLGRPDLALQHLLNPIGDITIGHQSFPVGELLLAGPQAAKALLASELTYDKEAMVEMGDIGYFDGDGIFWLLGRKGTTFQTTSGTLGPYAVEALLAPKLAWQGNITILPINGLLTLVTLEVLAADTAEMQAWLAAQDLIPQQTLLVPQMPKDKRHNARIDYNKVRRWSGKYGLHPLPPTGSGEVDGEGSYRD